MSDHPDLFNDRNVYILGAGFSADAGLPLLSDFMNRMRDALPWLEQKDWRAEVASIRRLLKFRQEAAGAAYRVHLNVENIEDLFSLAAAEENEDLEHDLVRAIAGTLAFAEQTATNTNIVIDVPTDFRSPASWRPVGQNQFEVHSYDYNVGVMSGFFSQGNLEDNSFITFNYDTVVESAARRLGIGYDYGFGRGRVRYEPRASYSPNVDAEVAEFRLFKIHGSVSWAYPGARGKKLTPYDSYDDLRKQDLVPVLVPPTWKKGATTGLNDAWAGAVRALEQATRIFIIGCSLPSTDSHFRFLLAAGLRNNISLRSIDFVNPSADTADLQSRVASIFPSHLLDQGILEFQPFALRWLCGEEGRRRLSRPNPPGLVIH